MLVERSSKSSLLLTLLIIFHSSTRPLLLLLITAFLDILLTALRMLHPARGLGWNWHRSCRSSRVLPISVALLKPISGGIDGMAGMGGMVGVGASAAAVEMRQSPSCNSATTQQQNLRLSTASQSRAHTSFSRLYTKLISILFFL
jgi:hypothetical protein